jgi:hypothetical protein
MVRRTANVQRALHSVKAWVGRSNADERQVRRFAG